MHEEPIDAALSAALDEETLDQLITRADKFSNQPNAAKGAAKFPSDPPTEQALLGVFDEHPEISADALRDSVSMWALLGLAARADVTLLDRLPEDITTNGAPKIASIRRAVKKHNKALAEDAAAGS